MHPCEADRLSQDPPYYPDAPDVMAEIFGTVHHPTARKPVLLSNGNPDRAANIPTTA